MLAPLPSYAPKLNLQQKVWRWLRADVTHDHFFGSLDAAVAAARHLFAKVTEQPAGVLGRMAVLSPHWSEALHPLRELH